MDLLLKGGEMDLNFSNEMVYTLPFYLGSILVLSILNYVRRQKHYRFNDTLTNASIAVGNLGFSLILLLGVVAIYSHVFEEYRFIELDQTNPLIYVFAFIAYDFCYYWNHRFHHMIGLLWADHIVHHTGEQFNLGVSVRISYFTELTMWMTFIPMALMGISIEVFLVVSYIEAVWAYCIHTEHFKKTPVADKVFNTPSHHRVHHARNSRYIDKNFGGVLIIWDKLFGTFQAELDKDPVVFGVRESYPSFSPLVINSYYLKNIWKKMLLSSTPWEVVCSIFAAPGWLPKKADRKTFYSATTRISCRDFKPYDPHTSLTTKWTSFIRFCVMLVLFTYLMSNFGTIGAIPATILSLLFFWLSHYNGIVLDGKKVGAYPEIIVQLLAASFVYWVAQNTQDVIVASCSIGLMVISAVNYIVYRQAPMTQQSFPVDASQQSDAL